MEKPAPFAEDVNINLFFVHRPYPAPRVCSLAAVNVNEPKNSMMIWVAFFGCNHLDFFRFSAHAAQCATGSMAITQKVLAKRTRQTTHALRMMLTSGVIRSATVDPPCMPAPQFQPGSSRILSPENSKCAGLVHTTDHTRHLGLLAYWQATCIDILKGFGRR